MSRDPVLKKLLLVLSSALVLCACRSSDDYVVVSKPFGLCALQSLGANYKLKSGIDVQAGTIERDDTMIGIYITLYPDISFSQREKARHNLTISNFSILSLKEVK